MPTIISSRISNLAGSKPKFFLLTLAIFYAVISSADPLIIPTYSDYPPLPSAEKGDVVYEVTLDDVTAQSVGTLPSMLDDDDQDGVVNIDDNCADTPIGTRIDECGCKALPSQLVYADSINFEVDSNRVTPNAFYLLDDLLNRAEGTVQSALITGHADISGKSNYNQYLSIQRAQKIENYFVERYGISSNIIFKEARGDRDPAFDNASAVNRMRNRRVEITLVTELDAEPKVSAPSYGDVKKNFKRLHFEYNSAFVAPNAERILDKIAQ